MGEWSLNYRVDGQGRPLVLVHGFGISFNIWRELLPFLTPRFTVVMVELPGVGGTPFPPAGHDYMQAAVAGIEDVRHLLGIDKWNVLGYSTGSRIAESYVNVDVAHVACAMFLCPLWIDAHKLRALRFGLQLDARMPAFGDWILSGWRLKLLISWLGFNLQHDPRLGEWYAEISAAPVRVLKDTVRAMNQVVSEPFSVPVPYALIWGRRDLVPRTPRRAGEHDYFVPGRHAAPVESAAEVASVIVSLAGERSNQRQPAGKSHR